MDRWWLAEGDSALVLPALEFAVDALVTDPPAGIGLMGRGWDSDRGGRDKWIAWLEGIMRECWRLMRPGAHGLVWALPRTSHWTAFALENAGFEIRDVVVHHFGSGFPKSLSVSKAIDAALGSDREPDEYWPNNKNAVYGSGMGGGRTLRRGTPVAAAAAAAAGFGTALKPAAEHWILVRRPLIGPVAANVLAHGTGGLNVDGCRVAFGGSADEAETKAKNAHGAMSSGPRVGSIYGEMRRDRDDYDASGRWPPNIVITHDARCTEAACHHECPALELDRQSGDRPGMSGGGTHRDGYAGGMFGGIDSAATARGDTGGASRFFPRFRYVAKPSGEERDIGLWDIEPAQWTDGRTAEHDTPRLRAGKMRRNHHPTVKPIELMRWLVRLITPPARDGFAPIVLDPFSGSGTTGCAAMLEGARFAGIEMESASAEVARRRIAVAAGERVDRKPLGGAAVVVPSAQQSLFAAADGGAP